VRADAGGAVDDVLAYNIVGDVRGGLLGPATQRL
jgi:hypothetical protein